MTDKDKQEILEFLKENLTIKLTVNKGNRLSQISANNRDSIWNHNEIYASIHLGDERISIDNAQITISE